MNKAKFTVAADALDRWRDDLLTGKPPVMFRFAEEGPLSQVEIGPQLITLVGGSPGSGKTGLVMQAAIDALRLNPELRVVVCNVEMRPAVLLDRQLARLSGVPLDAIRFRRLDGRHAERIDAGLATIEAFADRLCFVDPPFDLANVAATTDQFAPDAVSGCGLMLVLDYLQRIAPPGVQNDRRGSVDSVMGYLRQFSDAGAAVVVVSSVGRQKDNRGRSTYAADAMNLASFKESGELEFGADDAFILAPDKDPGIRRLMHLKARHGEQTDICLRFTGALQRFETMEPEASANESGQHEPTTGMLSTALIKAWRQQEPAEGEPWKP